MKHLYNQAEIGIGVGGGKIGKGQPKTRWAVALGIWKISYLISVSNCCLQHVERSPIFGNSQQ